MNKIPSLRWMLFRARLLRASLHIGFLLALLGWGVAGTYAMKNEHYFSFAVGMLLQIAFGLTGIVLWWGYFRLNERLPTAKEVRERHDAALDSLRDLRNKLIVAAIDDSMRRSPNDPSRN